MEWLLSFVDMKFVYLYIVISFYVSHRAVLGSTLLLIGYTLWIYVCHRKFTGA